MDERFQYSVSRWIGGGLILMLVVLVIVGQWRIQVQGANQWVTLVRHPQGVMATECMLAVVVSRNKLARGEDSLHRAEAALRQVESAMSNWQRDSDVTRIRIAHADESVAISDQTGFVIQAAQEAFHATDGTFDITCKPLIDLWQRAHEANELPKDEKIAEARAASGWQVLQLTDAGIRKHNASASIDLGGIAKGYGIDLALEAMRDASVRGGLVDVGGDMACFGTKEDGQLWTVDVADVNGKNSGDRVRLTDQAVATSGDYARFTKIDGQRYSHIIDPRTGFPTNTTRAVTVVAPTAMTADIWATALSILGTAGFDRLPEGVQAMVITDDQGKPQTGMTAGFQELLESPVD